MGVNTVIKDYGTDILNAIRENNLERLKSIFHKHLRTDKKIQKICTSDIKHRPTKKFACPIILAARQENPRILRYMLDHGTDPNFVHHTVFSSKRLEIVTALHICADLGYYDNLQALLDANADCNITDHNQETPLHLAVKKADKTMTRMLLSRGADPAVLDRRGNAALHIATMYGHLQLVRTLLQYNADVYQKGQGGAIAPHIAAKEGHIHLIQLFCSKDVGCVNVKLPCFADKREKTLLHLAAESGHVETVLALLHQFEADVSVKDSDDNTALHCTVLNRFDVHKMRDKDYYNETAKVLIKFGVGIDDTNAFGDTALHLAAMNQFQRIVEILLQIGASPHIANAEHLKPIDVVPDFDTVAKHKLKDAMLNPRPQASQSMTSLRRDLDLSMMDNSSIRYHGFDDSRSEMSFDDRDRGRYNRMRSQSQSSFMSGTTIDTNYTADDSRHTEKTDVNDNNRADHHQEQEIAQMYAQVNKHKRPGQQRDVMEDDREDDQSIAPPAQLTNHNMQDEVLRMQKQFKRYEESISGFSQDDAESEYLTMQSKPEKTKQTGKPKVNPRSTSSKTSTMTSVTTNKSQFEGDSVYDEIQDQYVRKTKGSAGHLQESETMNTSKSSGSSNEFQSTQGDDTLGTSASSSSGPQNIRVNAVAGKPGTIEVSYDGGANGPISITVDTNQSQFGVKTPGGEYDSGTLQQGFQYPSHPAPEYDKLKQSSETLATSVGEFEHAYSQSSYMEDYSRDNLDVSIDSSDLGDTPHHNNPDLLKRAIHQSVSDAIASDSPSQRGKISQVKVGSETVETEPYWKKPAPRKPGWNKPQAKEPEFNYMNLDMLNPPPRPPRNGKEESPRNSQYMNIDDIHVAPPPRPPKTKKSESASPPREVTPPPREPSPPPRPPKFQEHSLPVTHSSPRKETQAQVQAYHDQVQQEVKPVSSYSKTTTKPVAPQTNPVVPQTKPVVPQTKPVVPQTKPVVSSKPRFTQESTTRPSQEHSRHTPPNEHSQDDEQYSKPLNSFQKALAAARVHEDPYSSSENLEETPKRRIVPKDTILNTPEETKWKVTPNTASSIVENQDTHSSKRTHNTYAHDQSNNLKVEYTTHHGSYTTTQTTTHVIPKKNDRAEKREVTKSPPSDDEEDEYATEDRPPYLSQSGAKQLVFARPTPPASTTSDIRKEALSPVPRLPRGSKSRPSEEQTQQLPEFPSRAMQVSNEQSNPIADVNDNDNEVFPVGGGDRSIEYIDDSFGSEDIRMYTGTRSGDTSFSSEYRRGLNMHVSNDMPKAYTRQQTASARRAFMNAPPARIESGSEASDNEFNNSYYEEHSSRNSLVSPTAIGSSSVPDSPESPVDQMAEVDKRRKRKVRLIGPQPRPYRSFGKIETNTDALLEALEESREEIMSDPGDEPVHEYDPPIRAYSSNDVTHAYVPVDVEPEEMQVEETVPVHATRKPKRPQISATTDRQQQVKSPSSEYQYVDAEGTEEFSVNKPSSNTAQQSVAQSTFKQNIKFVQNSPSSMESYNVAQKVSRTPEKKQEVVPKIPPFRPRDASQRLFQEVPKPNPRTSLESSVLLDEAPNVKPRTSVQPVHKELPDVQHQHKQVDSSFDEEAEVSMYEEDRKVADTFLKSGRDEYKLVEDKEVAEINAQMQVPQENTHAAPQKTKHNEKHPDAGHLIASDVIKQDVINDPSPGFKITTTHEAKFDVVRETHQMAIGEQPKPFEEMNARSTHGKPARPVAVKPTQKGTKPPVSVKPPIISAKPKISKKDNRNAPHVEHVATKDLHSKPESIGKYEEAPKKPTLHFATPAQSSTTPERPPQPPPPIPVHSPDQSPPPLPTNSPPSLTEAYYPKYPGGEVDDYLNQPDDSKVYPEQKVQAQQPEEDQPIRREQQHDSTPVVRKLKFRRSQPDELEQHAANLDHNVQLTNNRQAEQQHMMEEEPQIAAHPVRRQKLSQNDHRERLPRDEPKRRSNTKLQKGQQYGPGSQMQPDDNSKTNEVDDYKRKAETKCKRRSTEGANFEHTRKDESQRRSHKGDDFENAQTDDSKRRSKEGDDLKHRPRDRNQRRSKQYDDLEHKPKRESKRRSKDGDDFEHKQPQQDITMHRQPDYQSEELPTVVPDTQPHTQLPEDPHFQPEHAQSEYHLGSREDDHLQHQLQQEGLLPEKSDANREENVSANLEIRHEPTDSNYHPEYNHRDQPELLEETVDVEQRTQQEIPLHRKPNTRNQELHKTDPHNMPLTQPMGDQRYHQENTPRVEPEQSREMEHSLQQEIPTHDMSRAQPHETPVDELGVNVSFEHPEPRGPPHRQEHGQHAYINDDNLSQKSDDKENKKGGFLAFSSLRKKKNKNKQHETKPREEQSSHAVPVRQEAETKSKRKGLFGFGKKKDHSELSQKQPSKADQHHIIQPAQHHIITADVDYNNMPVSAGEKMRAITPDDLNLSTDSDASSIGTSPTGIEGTFMGKRDTAAIDRNDTVRENDRKAGFFNLPSGRKKKSEQNPPLPEDKAVKSPTAKSTPIKWKGPSDISSAALNTDLDYKVEHESKPVTNVKQMIKNSQAQYEYEETSLDELIPLSDSKTSTIPTMPPKNRFEKMAMPAQESNLDEDVSVGSTDKDSESTNSDAHQQKVLIDSREPASDVAAQGRQLEHGAQRHDPEPSTQSEDGPPPRNESQNDSAALSSEPFRRQPSRRGRKKGRPLSNTSTKSSNEMSNEAEITDAHHNARNNQMQHHNTSSRDAQQHVTADVQVQDPQVRHPQHMPPPAHPSYNRGNRQQQSVDHHNNNLNPQQQPTKSHQWGQHGGNSGPPSRSQYGGRNNAGRDMQGSRNTSSSSMQFERTSSTSSTSSMQFNRTNSTSSTTSQGEPIVDNGNRSRSRSRDTSIMGKMFAAARPTTNVQIADVDRDNDDEYRNRKYKKNKRRQHSHDATTNRQRQVMNASFDSGSYKRGNAAMVTAKSMGALNDGQGNNYQQQPQQQHRQQRLQSADVAPTQQYRRPMQNNEAQMQAALQSMNMSTDVDDVFIPTNPQNLADNAMQKVRSSTEYSQRNPDVESSSGRWWGDSEGVAGSERHVIMKSPASRQENGSSDGTFKVQSWQRDQEIQEQQQTYKRQQKKAKSMASLKAAEEMQRQQAAQKAGKHEHTLQTK